MPGIFFFQIMGWIPYCTQEGVSKVNGEPKPATAYNTPPCLSWMQRCTYFKSEIRSWSLDDLYTHVFPRPRPEWRLLYELVQKMDEEDFFLLGNRLKEKILKIHLWDYWEIENK